MALVSGYPKELFKDRTSSDDGTVRRYTRHYHVKFSTWTDGPYAARTASGIPAYYSAHPSDSTAVVRSISVDPFEGQPDQFRVTVEYSSPEKGLTGQENPIPWLRPNIYETDSIITTKPLRVASFVGRKLLKFNQSTQVINEPTPVPNVIVTNSCNDFFDPQPEVEVSVPVLRVRKNLVYDLPGFLQTKVQYEGAINADVIFGLAPGQGRIYAINATREIENNYSYWAATYEIHMRAEGWDETVLDEGMFRYEFPNSSWRTLTRDANGTPGGGVHKLNGYGMQLALKQTPAPTDVIAAFLIYRPNQSLNFAPLGL